MNPLIVPDLRHGDDLHGGEYRQLSRICKVANAASKITATNPFYHVTTTILCSVPKHACILALYGGIYGIAHPTNMHPAKPLAVDVFQPQRDTILSFRGSHESL